MNIYVAGKLTDVSLVREVISLVRSSGHTVTLDWTQLESQGPDKSLDSGTSRTIAAAEKAAVLAADVLILLQAQNMLGALIETGIAMAHDRQVWVVDCCLESVFWHLPEVRKMTFEELTTALEECNK